MFSLLNYPRDSIQREVREIMLQATNKERGTLAGLAALTQALDNSYAHGE
jgi:hypothetical protein